MDDDATYQPMMDADSVVQLLGLQPHPEGGQFCETWRAPAVEGERSPGTAIYFLLRAGEVSHWHRVDATEIWLFHAGAPLALRTAAEGHPATRRILGTDLLAGQRPQLIVESAEWQSAVSLGAWTLVSCTVAPGFDFGGFDLAPSGWEPPGTLKPRGGAGPQ